MMKGGLYRGLHLTSFRWISHAFGNTIIVHGIFYDFSHLLQLPILNLIPLLFLESGKIFKNCFSPSKTVDVCVCMCKHGLD